MIPTCDGEAHAWRILPETVNGHFAAIAECCGVRAEFVRGERRVVPERGTMPE